MATRTTCQILLHVARSLACALAVLCISSCREADESEAPGKSLSSSLLESQAEDTGRPEPRKEDPSPADIPPVGDGDPKTPAELLDEAERVANHLVNRLPGDPDAYEMLGRMHLMLGNTQEAEKAWQRCLELAPNYVHAYIGLGRVASRRGDYERAAQCFRQALVVAPNTPVAQIELAKAWIEMGKLNDATEMLEQHVAQFPQSLSGWLQLGAASLQQKDYRKAKNAYGTAVRLSPASTEALFGLATAYARLGLNDEAQQYQREFQERRSAEQDDQRRQRNEYEDIEALREDVARLYLEMGRVYLAGGVNAAAERVWSRAATLRPQDVGPKQALAWFYLQHDRPADTIRVLKQLAALEPDNPSYPLEIARIYLRLDRPKDAQEVLENYAQGTAAPAPQ